MTAISKAWVTIADGQVDPDSPLDAALMQGLRDDLVHLREWIGASYTAGAVQNHSHDGVDSALVPIGANALRNGSFESGVTGWTTATFTGGTVAINTANAMDGVNCLAFTSTSTANGGGTATSQEFIPCATGMHYAVTALMLASAANVSSKIEILWYTAALAQISASTVYTTTSTPTAMAKVGGEAVAPATARFMRVVITGGVPGVGSATGTVYADRAIVETLKTCEAGTVLQDYTVYVTAGTTAVEVINYRILLSGTVRVSAAIRTSNTSYYAAYQVYKNGVAAGAAHTTYSATPVTFSDDIAVNTGDTLQFMLWNSAFTSTMSYVAFGVADMFSAGGTFLIGNGIR